MAEWQTHRTQNAAGNRVGSSPTAATTHDRSRACLFLLWQQRFWVPAALWTLVFITGMFRKEMWWLAETADAASGFAGKSKIIGYPAAGGLFAEMGELLQRLSGLSEFLQVMKCICSKEYRLQGGRGLGYNQTGENRSPEIWKETIMIILPSSAE